MNRILCVLILCMIIVMMQPPLTGDNRHQVYGVQKEVTVTNYRLDTGVIFLWKSSSGTWQNGWSPGSSKSWSGSLNIGSNRKNVKVYPYTEDNFRFNQPDQYHWNSNTLTSNKIQYDINYFRFSAFPLQVTGANTYHEGSGNLTVTYNATFVPRNGIPFNVKEELGKSGGVGKQYLIDLLDNPGQDILDKMNLMDPSNENYSSNVEGYLYFIPIIIQYDETRMVDSTEEPEEPEDGNEPEIEPEPEEEETGLLPDMSGVASLMLPEYTYEGHPTLAEDQSAFQANDVKYSAMAAYKSKLANNKFSIIPQTAGTVTKLVSNPTQANATFHRKGMYSVSLDIAMKNDQILQDIKVIEVRKTPYILDNLGGIQKVNRKQILNISVATYPDQPILDYYVKVKNLATSEEIFLSKSKPKENTALIKTRALKGSGDEYWTNFELEFLTKAKGEYQYTVYVKDAKGDSDIQQKIFTVRPDLPPDPIISVQDTFIRNKGTDIAEIILEDESTTDGDQLERSWSVSFPNPQQVDERGEGANEKYSASYQGLTGMNGYEDLSYGNGQKVKFHKQSVGKVNIKLHVRDVWNEPTLEEYITSDDYLSNETTAVTEVINIAPKITLEMGKSKEIDLIILAGKTSLPAISANINSIKAAFIEKSMDSNISLLVTNLPEEGNYRRIAEWEWPTTINCFTCQQNTGLMDSEFAYRIISPGKVMSGYQEVCITNAPHILEALCPGDEHCRCKTDSRTGQKISIGDPHVVWSYAINGPGNFGLFIDNLERYVYIADHEKKRTCLLNRKTGALVAEISFAMTMNPIVTDLNNNIYFVDINKIQRYDIKSNQLITVVNQGGSVNQIWQGRISFLAKKQGASALAGSGNGWYLGNFDMKTQQVYERGIPVLPGYSSNVTPCDLDVEGKALLRQNGKLWLVNTKTQAVISLDGIGSGNYMNSAGFVKDETGKAAFVYHSYSDIDYKGVGKFYFNLYRIQEKELQHFGSHTGNFTGYNGNDISYAKLHSNEGKIYILQGANWQSIDAVSSVKGFAFAVDVVTGVVNTGFGQWGWDQAEEAARYNGSLMNTVSRHDKWIGMTDRIRLFRNYNTGNQSKLFQLYTNGYFSEADAGKMIAVDANQENVMLKSDPQLHKYLDEVGASLIEQPGLEPLPLVEKVQEVSELPRYVLEMKGNGQDKLQVSKKFTLAPDTEYIYQYKVKSLMSQVNEPFYPIINYQSLGAVKDLPEGSLPVYKSLVLEETSGYRVEAKGSNYWGDSNTEIIQIQMEQDGILEFEQSVITDSYTTSSYEISLNGNALEAINFKSKGKVEKKSLFLPKGNHQIKLTVNVNRQDTAFLELSNVKIYNYGGQNDLMAEKNLKVTSGQSVSVKNRFYSPKEAAFVKSEKAGNVLRENFSANIPDYSNYLSFTLQSQGTLRDPIAWSFQPASRSASFGSTYFQNGEGNFHIKAPINKALVVSFKEQVTLPLSNTPTYSGGVMLSPTTVLVKPGETYSRYYYLSSGSEKGYGKVNISDIKIVEIDSIQYDPNRLFLSYNLMNFNLSDEHNSFAILNIEENTYKIIQFNEVNGKSDIAPNEVLLSFG